MFLLIKIDGRINSLDLWSHIEQYQVALTDLEEFSYVHGTVDYASAMKVIGVCALYGNLSIELSSPQ